jgi:hypothetical protein
MVTLMSEQSGRGDPGDRPRSGSDMLSDLQRDLQRWLIRSSARNMRSQVEDQVRRTLGGQRPDKGDVWDVATTEIPPEVGEAPECQWCPICRAARRMRDNRPGLAGQLSGAGDTVAGAVQDAVRAFDSLLSRTTGASAPATAPGGSPGGKPGAGPPTSPAREDGADGGGTESDAERPRPETGEPHLGGPDAASRPDSLAGEHGTVGWKPGDRLATAGPVAEDPWAAALEPGDRAEGATPAGGVSGGGTDDSGSTGSPASGEPDGREHGPSDRG